MKCVCPMGGDRTCPDDCPVATWENLSPADRKAQRKTIAKAMCKRGMTPERIAKEQGVHVATTYRDLEFSQNANTEPQVSKRGRKGEGRPKGRIAKPAPKLEMVQPAVDALVCAGLPVSRKKLASEFGVGSTIIQHAHIVARARLEVEQEIKPDMLSLTAQQKLDAAMRQHKRKLELEFDRRVMDEAENRLNTMGLPAWKKKVERAEAILRRDRGILTAAEYRLVRACLHPDRVQDIELKRKFADAFSIISRLEKFLCVSEEEPPSIVPRTWREAQSSASENRCTS